MMKKLFVTTLLGLPFALGHGAWDHGATGGVLVKYNTLPDCSCLGISPSCSLSNAQSLLNYLSNNACVSKCSTDKTCARKFMELSAWRWGCPYSAAAKAEYAAYESYTAACSECFVNPYNNNRKLQACIHDISCLKFKFDSPTLVTSDYGDDEDYSPSDTILYYDQLEGNWTTAIKSICANGSNCNNPDCIYLLNEYYATRMACPKNTTAEPPILFSADMYDLLNLCPNQAQCWINTTITNDYAANVTAGKKWCGSSATVLAQALVGSGASAVAVGVLAVIALALSAIAF